jgi:hypothetical protein
MSAAHEARPLTGAGRFALWVDLVLQRRFTLLRHFGIYEAGLRFGAFVSSRSRFSVRWR